jgi:hypothetical protein
VLKGIYLIRNIPFTSGKELRPNFDLRYIMFRVLEWTTGKHKERDKEDENERKEGGITLFVLYLKPSLDGGLFFSNS